MIVRPWSRVSPKLFLHQIMPTQLLVYNADRAIVVAIRRAKRNQVEARMQEVGLPAHTVLTLRSADRVEALTRQLLGAKARAIGLPPVLWTTSQPSNTPRDASSIGAGVVVAAGLVAFVPVIGVLLGLVAGTAVGLGVRRFWPGPVPRTGVGVLGHPDLDATDLHAQALAIERGQPPPVAGLPALDADKRVRAVRESYGALRTDLVYRIEHPALFDAKEPTTAAFEHALATFEASEGPARDRLAGEIEVAFNVARANAERRGLRHVEEAHRADVRRAAKAARLAARAGTEGERVASLTRVQRILDSVALYYLPASTDEILAIQPPA